MIEPGSLTPDNTLISFQCSAAASAILTLSLHRHFFAERLQMPKEIRPMSTTEAKHYLDLLEMAPAQHRGPHRFFKNPAVDAAEIVKLAPRLIASIEQRNEQTYFAPSAWHAAAWLLDIAALAGQLATSDADTGMRTPYDTKYGAPVFRGQRDPAKSLVPSLFRPSASIADGTSLYLLITLLQELFNYDENRANNPLVHMAALQHYGMPTPLLDFTCDPRVAVYFACGRSTDSAAPEAVVYGTPLGLLSGLGGAVVLPPPWVKRLYAQRGLFLDCSEMQPNMNVEQICFRVLFPPDPEFWKSHEILREGTLLPPEPWYEAAIAWMQRAIHVVPASSTTDELVRLLRRDCNNPPFWLDAMSPAAMVPSLDQFVDMFQWLAMKLNKEKKTPYYDPTTVEILGKYNIPLFREHRATWKYLVNLFSPGDPRRLSGHPMFAAFEAVDSYLNELDRKPTPDR
jgi:hypothetical protein